MIVFLNSGIFPRLIKIKLPAVRWLGAQAIPAGGHVRCSRSKVRDTVFNEAKSEPDFSGEFGCPSEQDFKEKIPVKRGK
jgi:hypothetical protein